jgi:hypothetical protein
MRSAAQRIEARLLRSSISANMPKKPLQRLIKIKLSPARRAIRCPGEAELKGFAQFCAVFPVSVPKASLQPKLRSRYHGLLAHIAQQHARSIAGTARTHYNAFKEEGLRFPPFNQPSKEPTMSNDLAETVTAIASTYAYYAAEDSSSSTADCLINTAANMVAKACRMTFNELMKEGQYTEAAALHARWKLDSGDADAIAAAYFSSSI